MQKQREKKTRKEKTVSIIHSLAASIDSAHASK